MKNILSKKEKALLLAKHQLAKLVYDAVNLEGIDLTLQEVQNVLAGLTQKNISSCDQNITLNQSNAWKYLFQLIQNDAFQLNKQIVCDIHAIAAKEEALKWGRFREGSVTITGTNYTPPPAKELDQHWETMLLQAEKISDIYERAIFIFLQMARNQFFYDVNKRMGRFMMNGLLLKNGYPVINLPAKKQTEFNKLMLDFYSSNDTEAMTVFMKNCLDPRIIEIMNEAHY